MLVDKNSVCPVDGLNQMFKIVVDENNKRKVIVSDNLKEDYLHPQMLIKVNADPCCDQIVDSRINYEDDTIPFTSFIKKISNSLKTGEKLKSLPSNACKDCQFKATDEEIKMGYKSGFKECLKESLGWMDEDFKDPTVLEIWDFRRKEQLINENRIKMSHVTREDINIKSSSKSGLSRSQRQWIQVEKVQNNGTSHYIDIENLSKEMDQWNFPLHFIDFETSQPAIPFNKGRRPYEEIAFQYSHHIINKDGSLQHKSEYLNTEPGVFPNYEFIENLKKDLAKDDGTIFCYAPHENTYLNAIRKQLLEDDIEHPKKEDLCRFIESITTPTRSSLDIWKPTRKMVDLLDLVKRYYYNPLTNGSNSIKDVLPAILNTSDYLKDKYSKPVYGTLDGIPSLNYKDWIWIEYDEAGNVKDPYELLPPMFQDLSDKEYKLLGVSNIISDGGAALTAYGKLQYENISDYERNEMNAALLKYCELDTLAMVMIYEAWREFTNSNNK